MLIGQYRRRLRIVPLLTISNLAGGLSFHPAMMSFFVPTCNTCDTHIFILRTLHNQYMIRTYNTSSTYIYTSILVVVPYYLYLIYTLLCMINIEKSTNSIHRSQKRTNSIHAHKGIDVDCTCRLNRGGCF